MIYFLIKLKEMLKAINAVAFFYLFSLNKKIVKIVKHWNNEDKSDDVKTFW